MIGRGYSCDLLQWDWREEIRLDRGEPGPRAWGGGDAKEELVKGSGKGGGIHGQREGLRGERWREVDW